MQITLDKIKVYEKQNIWISFLPHFLILPGTHEGQQSPGLVLKTYPSMQSSCGHHLRVQLFVSVVN